MSACLRVRPERPDDYRPWIALWRNYCGALGGVVTDAVSDGLWRRILAADEPVFCLLACLADGEPIGFAHYVLHPHTWGLRMVCYLEDLFVMPKARGLGAGRALIDELVALGKQQDWERVYWHTHETNEPARALYDRVVARTDYIRYDIEL